MLCVDDYGAGIASALTSFRLEGGWFGGDGENAKVGVGGGEDLKSAEVGSTEGTPVATVVCGEVLVLAGWVSWLGGRRGQTMKAASEELMIESNCARGEEMVVSIGEDIVGSIVEG